MLEPHGFELRPPAQRGDVAALQNETPGLLVLVDGRFHQSLAVGHAELRRALDSGWVVWGLGSMGAIRAYEMRSLGMLGFGRVFEHFLGDEDYQDDEVALLHSPEPPYIPVTEPLVHVRHWLAAFEAKHRVERQLIQRVVDALKVRWYGERTLETLVSEIDLCGSAAVSSAAREFLACFDLYRVKTLDVSAFFEARVWERANYQPNPTPAPYSRTARWVHAGNDHP